MDNDFISRPLTNYICKDPTSRYCHRTGHTLFKIHSLDLELPLPGFSFNNQVFPGKTFFVCVDVCGIVHLGTTARWESWKKSGNEDETQMGGKELNMDFS